MNVRRISAELALQMSREAVFAAHSAKEWLSALGGDAKRAFDVAHSNVELFAECTKAAAHTTTAITSRAAKRVTEGPAPRTREMAISDLDTIVSFHLKRSGAASLRRDRRFWILIKELTNHGNPLETK